MPSTDNKKATSSGLFAVRESVGQLVVAGKLGGGQGAAEQVTLQAIAARLCQPGLLLHGFHPFGGDPDAEFMAEPDDGADDGGGGLVAGQPLGEAPV